MLIAELFAKNMPEGLRFYLVNKSIYTSAIIQSVQPQADVRLAYRQILNVLEYIQNSLYKINHIALSFALSAPVLQLHQLPDCYETLCRILIRQGGGQGTGALLTLESDNAVTSGTAAPAPGGQRYEQLREYLETGYRDQYFSLLREICACFYTSQTAAPYALEEVYYSLAVMLLSFSNANALSPLLGPAYDPYRLLGTHPSWQDAAVFLAEYSARLFDLMHSIQKGRTEKVMDVVVNYIAENLHDNLTLSKLAELVHFNQSYFSRLFKQEMNGVNLSQYILTQRMERAKDLLEHTSLKIQEIAPMVGYQSSHSFSRLFRSVTGLSPQDYRVMRLCGTSAQRRGEENK